MCSDGTEGTQKLTNPNRLEWNFLGKFKTVTARGERLLLDFYFFAFFCRVDEAGAGGGARVGMLGGPVFGGERYAPELRARLGKFQADFGFAVANGAEEHHVAFLIFFGHVVLHFEAASAGDAILERDQSAVGVDGQGVGLFLERFALRVFAADEYAHLHKNTLAAATHRWMCGGIGYLAHDSLTSLNYTPGRGVVEGLEVWCIQK